MTRRRPLRGAPGTVGALVAAYRQSPRYLGWAPRTRVTFGAILEDFGTKNRDVDLGAITRGAVKRALYAITAERGPGAARNWLKVMRGLFGYALDVELIEVDPTAGVSPPPLANPDGYATWRPDHVEAFRARWPIGTPARRALEVLYVTGAACVDAVTLGPWHVRDEDVIAYRRRKSGAWAYPRLLPDLAAALDGWPEDRTWLATETGAARSAAGLNGSMDRWREAAGLPPGLSPHGLRKARGVALADAGAQPHEIAAWLGHRTLAEVARYTAQFDRAAATGRAAEKLATAPKSVVKRLPSR